MIRFLDTIFRGSDMQITDHSGRWAERFGSKVLAILAMMRTALKIYQGAWLMAAAAMVLTIGFLIADCLCLQKRQTAANTLTGVLLGAAFSLFALCGENDGYAALWIVLLPVAGIFLVGQRVSLVLNLYLMLFLTVLFYTPLSGYVEERWAPSLAIQLPVLYAASFGTVTFLLYRCRSAYREVHQRAYCDALTNLYNRLYYNELRKRIQDTGVSGELTVFSMDINGLKHINDTRGHEAGDELIRGAARLIADAFCEDACCRIGGDEFAVISTRKDAFCSVLMLREEAAVWQGELVQGVSISIGCASAAEYPDMTLDGLLHQADRNMYADKANYYKTSGMERRQSVP